MKRIAHRFRAAAACARTLHRRARAGLPLRWALALVLRRRMAAAPRMQRAEAAEAQLAALRARACSRPPRHGGAARASAPSAPAQAAAVNGAILQLNLPWRDLQDALAAATPASIALLALEPDAQASAC